MALEDFTTYVETDPGGKFTVAANTVTVAGVTRVHEYHIEDDKGAGHFTDYEHLVQIKMTSGAAYSSCAAQYVTNVANTREEMKAANHGIVVYMYLTSTNVPKIYIMNYTNDNSDYYTGVNNTDYWLTIKRVNATTTATVKIYSDALRTVLVDTLTIESDTTAYSKVGVCCNEEKLSGTQAWSGYVKDLDLQEVEPDVSAGIKIWDGAADIELVEDNTSPVKIETPGGTIGVKLVATGHADASAIRIFDGVATKAFKKKT